MFRLLKSLYSVHIKSQKFIIAIFKMFEKITTTINYKVKLTELVTKIMKNARKF